MAKSKSELHVTDEIVMSKILLVRGRKVMIDRDLAELYGVSTKRLNEQVKRNAKRFPADFMYQLTVEEKQEVVAKCDHLKTLKYSPQLPYVFTEYGAVMLASVLNSERAIEVNIQIVRIFTRMREMLQANQEILLKLEQLERQTFRNSEDIQMIFAALKELLNPAQEPRPRIGFRRPGEEQ
ncbi:MAG TPA: ORF6N domain-containing protein [Puia sp.]|nr:ORF6N domain-containing protein [Puia sp.]